MKLIEHYKIVLLISTILLSIPTIAQEEHSGNPTEEHHEFKRHVVAVQISHTLINSAKENPDGNDWIAAPSYIFNYNFNFSEKWALGLHNDIIIENIDLEDTSEGGDGINREHVISSAIVASYKPFSHLAFLLGSGMEFSKHKDFQIIRFGIEAPFHLPNNWEMQASLTTDIGIDSYNSFTLGFGIAKLF